MATSVKLNDQLKARVQNLATLRDRKPHWIMLEAINEYVEREEKREAFKRDTLSAWNAYEATGKHVTFDEADAWMAKLAAGEYTPPPSSHT